MNRKFGLILTVAVVSFFFNAAIQAQGASLRRPNIIFILADDLGWGDLGCYGQTQIKTPRLDRMAAEGMRFTQVYAGSTVCAPSRFVLMTGQHTGHTRIRGNGGYALFPEDVTVAEVLKTKGYATACIGKWGLGLQGTTGHPNRQGFDYFYGYLHQGHAHNYYPTHLWRDEEKVLLSNVVPDERASGAGVATEQHQYSHDLIAEEGLRFVRDNADGPFFLYFALTIPHANNEAKSKGMEVPELGAYEPLDWPEPQKGHAAMITRMDRDIGRLFDLLKALEIDDRTIVFFSSDNGPHREGGNDPAFNDSNGPLRGIKRDLYEGGIRVPTIVWWPGRIPSGSVSDAVWYFADFLPTVVDLARARAPKHLDGISLKPTLLGKRQNVKERFLYWEFHERRFKQAVRFGPWKAVRLGLDQPLELYHLTADVGEKYDLAAHNPSIVAEIEAYLCDARVDSPRWPIEVK